MSEALSAARLGAIRERAFILDRRPESWTQRSLDNQALLAEVERLRNTYEPKGPFTCDCGKVFATCPICLHTLALGELVDHLVREHGRELAERLRRAGSRL